MKQSKTKQNTQTKTQAKTDLGHHAYIISRLQRLEKAKPQKKET